jgi:hypothetical protein
MKRLLFAVGVIVAVWVAAFVVFALMFPGGPRLSVQIALIGVLWVAALVVCFFLVNPEGLMSRYLVIAAGTLVAATVFVSLCIPLLQPPHT